MSVIVNSPLFTLAHGEQESEDTSNDTNLDSVRFTIDTGRLLWTVFLSCLTIELTLVYLDLTINWQGWTELSPIRRLFNATREDALASWFAVTQTVFVAVCAWIIVALNRKQTRSRLQRLGWILIALFLTYVAIDDGAAIHERIGSAYKENAGGIVDFPSYIWQMVLGPVFAVIGAFLVVFLWRKLPRTRDRARILAAMACFAIAVWMDYVEGTVDGFAWLIETFDWDEAAIQHFSRSIEEFIEMLGMTLFLVTFLGHIARRGQQIIIRFQTKP